MGDKGRVVEEEKSKNTEVGHQNASYNRPITSEVDVSNLPKERYIVEERGREGAISRRSQHREQRPQPREPKARKK